MAHYPFKLVDHRIVSDYGTHNLADEADAKSEPIKLARSLRASRPEFIGLNYSISVPDKTCAGVCIIPLHVEQFEQRGLTNSAGRRAQSPYDQPCQKDRFSLWHHLIQGSPKHALEKTTHDLLSRQHLCRPAHLKLSPCSDCSEAKKERSVSAWAAPAVKALGAVDKRGSYSDWASAKRPIGARL
jgi:hypothetical protein